MTTRVHCAVGVLNQTPFDWRGNRARVLEAISRARGLGVTLLSLPEMCLSGYGCEDMFHSAELLRRSADMLFDVAAHTSGMVVSVGLPVMHRGGVYNAAALLADGEVLGLSAKRFLAGDGIHYEPRWFKPWPDGAVTTIELGDADLPLGDLIFDVGDLQIGFEICEDAWVAQRPGGWLSLEGVDVVINPSASHFAFGKQEVRRRLVLEGSRAFGVTYLYSNLVGNESGRAIFDGGAMIAQAGRMLTETSRFTFGEVELATAVVDVDATRLSRARTASFRPVVGESRRNVEVSFAWPRVAPRASRPEPPAWEQGPRVKEEEFTRAVSLALWDYLQKSRSHGYALSLSGGADSAACACLVRAMLELATAELGLDEVKRRLGHIPKVQAESDVAGMTRALLTTVYQPTGNSSDVTREAARAVAEAVGADHLVLDVDALVKSYISLVEGAVGRSLSWETDDIPLQNIQARSRGPSVWMLANLRNQILLSTSNRSEAAVGYATMDGDTCGGISPIAGIDKAFLRQWLRVMETHGCEGVPAVPALSKVNVQQPTAELRPLEKAQTDEDDLMPYPLLDAIEKVAIRDKKGPMEAFELMREAFPGYEVGQLRTWVVRFFRMWCINQWKRERYAPSFHLDDENLDPKTWCRFPILSGGFRLELEELGALDLAQLEPAP